MTLSPRMFDLGQPLSPEILRYYEDLSLSAWQLLGKGDESKLDCNEFMCALESIGIVIFYNRAQELFSASAQCDGLVELTDFEIALMVNDAVQEEADLSLYEAFKTFDLENCGRLSLDQYLQACYSLGHKDRLRLTDYFTRAVNDGDGSRRVDYNSFVRIWCNKLCVDPVSELHNRGITIHEKTKFGIIFRPLSNISARRELFNAILQSDVDLSSLFVDAKQKIIRLRADLRRCKDKLKRNAANKKHKRARVAGVASSQFDKQRRSSIRREEIFRTELEEKGKHFTQELHENERLAKLRSEEEAKKFQEEERQRELQLLRSAGEKLCIRSSALDYIPLSLYESPEVIQKLSRILILDLSGNKLSSLPKTFASNLVSLRKLILSHNELRELSSEVQSMQQLQILRIDGNVLQSLPDIMPKSLLHIDVACNKLISINGVCGLDSLISLVGHSNLIERMPDSFGRLSNLEILDLSNNRLSYLPESFSRLLQLVKADFHSNSLYDLPTGWDQLVSLEVLDLSFNKIQELPSALPVAGKLRVVRIQNNCLQELSKSVCTSDILSLDCGGNNICRISHDFGRLSSLQQLLAPANRIDDLPKEIGLLTDLFELNLRNNCISWLPEEIGALERSLHKLDLSYNKLKDLPTSFCLLSHLSHLNLSHNNIQCLPDSFGALTHLEELDISHNVMEVIPFSVKDLCRLKTFMAHSNTIKVLDAELLRGLRCLERIDLSSNQLDTLPLQLAEMMDGKGLQVNISMNPLRLCLLKTQTKSRQYLGLVENATANEWLREEAALYLSAISLWGAADESAKSSFDLFAIAVLKEMNRKNIIINDIDVRWKEIYIRFLRLFFEKSRDDGSPPSHDDLKNVLLREIKEDVERIKATRTANALKAKEDDLRERRRLDGVYYYHDLVPRMEAASISFDKRAEVMKNNAGIEDLKLAVAKNMLVQDARAAALAEKRKRKHDKEVEALISLVGSTAPGSAKVTLKRTLPFEIDPCWQKGAN